MTAFLGAWLGVHGLFLAVLVIRDVFSKMSGA